MITADNSLAGGRRPTGVTVTDPDHLHRIGALGRPAWLDSALKRVKQGHVHPVFAPPLIACFWLGKQGLVMQATSRISGLVVTVESTRPPCARTMSFLMSSALSLIVGHESMPTTPVHAAAGPADKLPPKPAQPTRHHGAKENAAADDGEADAWVFGALG